MKPVINIRLATERDVADIIEVARVTWQDVYDGIILPEIQKELLSKWYSPEAVKNTMKRANSWFYVAENQGRVIGYAQFILRENDRGDLSRIYVLPEWQGRRVGSRLLEKGKRALLQKGAKELSAQVETHNERGIIFYERRGFRRGREYNEVVSNINLPHVEYILSLQGENFPPGKNP